MLRDQINSRKQGDVGLGAAIGWFTSQGFTVCVPLTDSQKFDLVVEFADGLKKVQVKTAYYKRKHYEVTIQTSGGNKSRYTHNQFDNSLVDYLFVLTEEAHKYLIPAKDVSAKKILTLCGKYNKYLL